MNEPVINLHFRFEVLEEKVLRDLYNQYVECFPGYAPEEDNEEYNDLAKMAEELILNLDMVSEMLDHLVEWGDIGLQRLD